MNYDEIYRKYIVSGLVRIPTAYFPHTLTRGALYLHFHLNNHDHNVGDHYFMVPIIPRENQDPLLVEGEGFRVKCIEFEADLDLLSIQRFQFASQHLNSQDKVRTWIQERYLHRSCFTDVDKLLDHRGGVSRILLKKL
jgi:hypothetical protein